MKRLTLEERVDRLEKLFNKNESSEDDGWHYTEPKDKIIKDWFERVNRLIRKNWEVTSQTDNEKLSETILEKDDQVIVYRVIDYAIPSTGEHELHCIYTYDDNSPDESYESESEVDVWKQDSRDPNKFYLNDAGMTYSEYKRSFRKGKPFIRK